MSQAMMPADTGALSDLRSGDHLSQKTFHERYEAMPDDFKAELIEGVVIVQAAASAHHGDCHGILIAWLNVYRADTPGTRVLDNATTILSPQSEVQPDASLIVEAECGGQTRRVGDYLSGPPELIVEVAFSSAAYDLHSKLRVYERAGVREYIVVVLHEGRVEWFALKDRRFESIRADESGLFESTVFPGLWLGQAALLRRDVAAVLETLERGLAAPEHAAFVEQLKQKTEP